MQLTNRFIDACTAIAQYNGEVDDTRLAMFRDMQQDCRAIRRMAVGYEVPAYRQEYLRIMYSRACDPYLMQMPVIAEWVNAYREM